MKKIIILTMALAAMAAFSAAADKPNFSGDWTVDVAKTNFGPIPGPTTRKVEHNDPALTMTETQTGGAQGNVTTTAKFSTDGTGTINKAMGGDAKSTATWDGNALAIVMKGEVQSRPRTLTERWTLSDDGKVMTVTRHIVLAQTEIGAATYVLNKDPDGAALYRQRCATCHDNSQSQQLRMPKREEIAARTPEAIMAAMFSGAMVTQAAGLTQKEGRAIARFLTGKDIGTVSENTAGQYTGTALGNFCA